MSSMQVIEYRTNPAEGGVTLLDELRGSVKGKRTVLSETYGRDHNDQGHFIDIVSVPSVRDLPATARYAERMRALCVEEPRITQFDVLDKIAGWVR